MPAVDCGADVVASIVGRLGEPAVESAAEPEPEPATSDFAEPVCAEPFVAPVDEPHAVNASTKTDVDTKANVASARPSLARRG